MQIKKFRKIFEHARDNSRFYHELYSKHNILDLKIKTIDDVEKVPIINKALLKQYDIQDIITNKSMENLNIFHTSGSTGEPFELANTKYENFTSHLRVLYILIKYGYNPYKKMVYISRYGKNHSFNFENSDLGPLIKKLKLFPIKHISATEEQIDSMIQAINDYKPFIIWSNPSTLLLIANKLESKDMLLNIPLGFLLAESISENETKILRKRVCSNIIDMYGCMESPTMAYSYNSDQFKEFITTSVYAEVIDQHEFNGSKVGNLIITNLVNKTMPFIRYEIGDFVEVINDNGFPQQRIGKVHGRYNDILMLDSENFISYRHCYKMFSNILGLEKHKLIQYPSGELILQIKVKNKDDSEMIKNRLLSIWNESFPDYPLKVEYKDVFEIDKKTGKFKVLEKLQS